MKRTTLIICMCILVGAFAFMFAFSVFFPRTTTSDYSILYEWPEFSVESLLSGKYFNGITKYFTDTINSRDKFVDFEASIRSLYGVTEENQVIQNNGGESDPDENAESDIANTSNNQSNTNSSTMDNSTDNGYGESSNIIEGSQFEKPDNDTSSDTTSENVPNNGETIKGEISNDILIAGTRAMEIFYGNKSRAVIFANVIDTFAESLDASVNVYSMVIPKASAYYIGQVEGYQHLASRNKDNIDAISNTTGNRVVDVDIYNTLGLHANEPIYLRTDHHWSALGAFYASTVFAEKAGVSYSPLESYTEVSRQGYLGTMYKYTNYSPILKNNPEDFLVYYPDADYTVTYYSSSDLQSKPRSHDGGFFWEISDEQRSSWYSTFIRGDSYSVKAVSNECKNGRKLLIVKDSYGNALAPYMLEGFEEIYIVDARKYTRSLKETISAYGITDVLFAECTFSAVSENYINSLEEICK